MPAWLTTIPLVAEGGPLMLVLYALSLVALAVALERAVSLRGERILPPDWAAGILDVVERQGIAALGRGVGWPNVPAASALARMLESEVRGTVELRDVAELLAERERPSLERGLGLLGLGAALAPLLGLLGTVTGMILTFRAIADIGVGDPKLLAGGIYQALYTTAVGLAIAIPATVAHRSLKARAEQRLTEIADFVEMVGRRGGLAGGERAATR